MTKGILGIRVNALGDLSLSAVSAFWVDIGLHQGCVFFLKVVKTIHYQSASINSFQGTMGSTLSIYCFELNVTA